ncbi:MULTISPECIES: Ppx/GppA phosphatase family protein [unclassified Aminobacter]|uniref:Ppx/GppA phosphatase family protein n=1 Tax=unclassified Aminobacter TaxID=2644704 RepID=UPI0004667884|nr:MULTISPECIES: Ppx/GppA phosphatase family protein [unclassified Aminobacter]
MEDPDRGAKAPQNGAFGGVGGRIVPAAPPPGRQSAQAGGDSAGTRSGRNAPQGKGPNRKRRKRRRGRKVFAREGADGAAPQADVKHSSPAGPAQKGRGSVSARAPLPKVPPAPPAGPKPAPARQIGGTRTPGIQPARSNELPVYAALDLGTNNCRLLVAVPTRPGQFRVIDAFSRIVRLGEGLSTSGRLGKPAMDRAIEALKVCGDKLRSRHVRRARLIATEACRSAENGIEFLERVKREAGISLEIIDRKTEARLAVSGCGSLVDRSTDGVVLFDIGGGSSEIALIDLSTARTPRLANHIVSWTSLPVGVVSLAERFGGRDVTPELFQSMVEEVSGMLDRFEGKLRLAHVTADRKRFHLLGTSGTVTTLAGVHLGLDRYDRRRVDGLWMDNRQVDAMINKLLGWNFEQRVANACIGADRADLVLAGCAILEAIRRHWPAERLRVADRGLREGMLSELMADDGAWRRWRKGASGK